MPRLLLVAFREVPEHSASQLGIGSAVTCPWEATSVESVQEYVDSTLGDSSVNTCYEVNAEQAFAEQPSEFRAPPATVAR